MRSLTKVGPKLPRDSRSVSALRFIQWLLKWALAINAYFPFVLTPVSPPANRVVSFDFRQKNTSVKVLNLGGNNIGNEGAAAIAKVLEVGS